MHHSLLNRLQTLQTICPSQVFDRSRLTQATAGAALIGVFHDIESPVYDGLTAGQIELAQAERGVGNLDQLREAGETWTVE